MYIKRTKQCWLTGLLIICTQKKQKQKATKKKQKKTTTTATTENTFAAYVNVSEVCQRKLAISSQAFMHGKQKLDAYTHTHTHARARARTHARTHKQQ